MVGFVVVGLSEYQPSETLNYHAVSTQFDFFSFSPVKFHLECLKLHFKCLT